MSRRNLIGVVAILAVSMLLVSACALVKHSLQTGGEEQLKPMPPPSPSGIHVLVFAMDGATPA